VTDPVVLAVDLGTGGPKVALVTARGEVVWQDFVPVSTRLVDGGGAEQDPADWWEAVTSRTRAAMASGAVRPEQVVAVSCTGQWASTVPVDAAGEPVGPCIMWMDQRGGPHAKRVVGGPVQGYHPRKLVTWLRKSGGVPSPTGNDPVGQRLFLRAERPEVHHRAACFLEPVDYLNLRFTGVAAASPASMTAAWLVDTRDPASAGYDDALVRLSTLDPAQLPRLLATGAVVGTGRAGGDRHPRPALGPFRRRRDRRLRGACGHQLHLVAVVPRALEAERPDPPGHHGARSGAGSLARG
jgi:xylulokinase